MLKLNGKVQRWNLSGNKETERAYINTNVNFGLIRQYATIKVYDPFNGTGEQRIAKERHRSKMKGVISNSQYTPTTFYVHLSDVNQSNIDDDGNVTVDLSEENKLIIVDAGTRTAALNLIQEEAKGGPTSRKVDDLPIPLIVYLNPERRAEDFINLNSGLAINQSHLKALKVRNGLLSDDKLSILRPAMELAKLLDKTKFSPLNKKISFGETHNPGSIQLSQLCSDRKASLIGSLYGTVKLLHNKDESQFVEFIAQVYDFIKIKTTCAENGKLLALPPDGAKGCVANVIGVTNVIMHYLYLREQISGQQESLDDHSSHIVNAISIYNNNVGGDVGGTRLRSLICAFTQRLFQDMETDDLCPTVFHFGIPLSLLNAVSHSSFGVEAPPNLATSRKTKIKEMVEQVEQTKLDSDTDPLWEE